MWQMWSNSEIMTKLDDNKNLLAKTTYQPGALANADIGAEIYQTLITGSARKIIGVVSTLLVGSYILAGFSLLAFANSQYFSLPSWMLVSALAFSAIIIKQTSRYSTFRMAIYNLFRITPIGLLYWYEQKRIHRIAEKIKAFTEHHDLSLYATIAEKHNKITKQRFDIILREKKTNYKTMLEVEHHTFFMIEVLLDIARQEEIELSCGYA